MHQGFSQVVILGAGFDTRAVRKQTAGVTFFEIDDPGTLKLKKERLEVNHIDAGAKLIPGNYVTDDLTGMLESSGFDAALPTHFIWEDNTMYLSAEAVHHVMQTIGMHVKQFTLAFDYMAPEVIAKTTGDPAITKVVERFAAMGAPWIFGIGNLAEFAAREGMAVVEDQKTASLYRAYRPGGTLDSPLFSYYSLCTLAPARRLTR